MMGFDGWGFMGFGPIAMVLFWVLFIAGTVWLVLAVSGQARPRDGGAAADRTSAARRILDERLARGEIDVEEHRSRAAALGGER